MAFDRWALYQDILTELGDRPATRHNLAVAAARLPAEKREQISIASKSRFDDEPGFWKTLDTYIFSKRDPQGFAEAEAERQEEEGRDADYTIDPGIELAALEQARERREDGR